MARYIFIGIGGTGAKVAEAMVNLLTLGAPLGVSPKPDQIQGHRQLEDKLEIYRYDTDTQCGAGTSLEGSVKTYRALREALDAGDFLPGLLWTLPIEGPKILAAIDQKRTSGTPSVNHILADQANTQDSGKDPNNLLRLFYTKTDREQDLSRGFYQKSFIGSAILSAFSENLKETLGLTKDGLDRIFICGSLYGGTGSSGLPVLGQHLGALRKAQEGSKWVFAGCALGAYFRIPPPPNLQYPDGSKEFAWAADIERYKYINELLDEGKRKEDVDDWVEKVWQANKENTELNKDRVREILGGYFCREDEITPRTAISAQFYKDKGLVGSFDRLYLVGQPNEDRLPSGSIFAAGGESQKNASFATEYVAACAALDFFAGPAPSGSKADDQWAAAVTQRQKDNLRQGLSFTDLPCYGADSQPNAGLDPNKWLLATAIAGQVCLHHLGPFLSKVDDIDGLKGTNWKILEETIQERSELVKFKNQFANFCAALTDGLLSICPIKGDEKRDRQTLGWETGDAGAFRALFETPHKIENLGWVSGRPVVLALGNCELQVQKSALMELRDLRIATAPTEHLFQHYVSLIWKYLYTGVKPRTSSNK